MTERDDYLFDPKAPVDPEIAALEKSLAPLARRDAPWRDVPVVPLPRLRTRAWPWLAAAALLVAAVIAFAVSRGENALRPFAAPRTFVTTTATLAVPLGDLAQITLRPGSELDFVHWRKDELRFVLRRGGLEARVAPPPAVQPRFFKLDTELGVVIDEGCRYELDLRDDGSARVAVAEGAVSFDSKERTVFVPVGAAAIITADGASTPLFADAAPEFAKAVMEFDAVRRTGSLEQRFETMKMLSAAARDPRDSLAMWHVLRTDPEPELRKVAEAELFRLTGGPDGGKTKNASFDPEEWLAFLRLEVWR